MSPVYEKPILHGRDHCPDGADPIPCLPDMRQGTDIEDLILAAPGLDAFWKLNETSGEIAHDSSGNEHHLTTDGTWDPPTWGQAVGPPGATTAAWGTSTTRVVTPAGEPMADFSDDFSAGLFVNVQSPGSPDIGEIMGQGTAYHSEVGWNIMLGSGKFIVLVDGNLLYANNPFDLDSWYFLAVVRDSGTWKLYVNGLLQAATFSHDPGTGYGQNTWLGNDAFPSHSSYLKDSLLSYAFIADSVLAGSDLLAIYDAGTSGGALETGQVWTTDGAGGASWQPNLETIAKEGATALTGDVTLSEGSNITLTQTGQEIEISASGGGGSPADDTLLWMPLTTVVASVPELVWDADDNLIPTLTPI